jgi:hypothetical protein
MELRIDQGVSGQTGLAQLESATQPTLRSLRSNVDGTAPVSALRAAADVLVKALEANETNRVKQEGQTQVKLANQNLANFADALKQRQDLARQARRHDLTVEMRAAQQSQSTHNLKTVSELEQEAKKNDGVRVDFGTLDEPPSKKVSLSSIADPEKAKKAEEAAKLPVDDSVKLMGQTQKSKNPFLDRFIRRAFPDANGTPVKDATQAKVVASQTAKQVLSQSGVAVLAQANTQPSEVLSALS